MGGIARWSRVTGPACVGTSAAQAQLRSIQPRGSSGMARLSESRDTPLTAPAGIRLRTAGPHSSTGLNRSQSSRPANPVLPLTCASPAPAAVPGRRRVGTGEVPRPPESPRHPAPSTHDTQASDWPATPGVLVYGRRNQTAGRARAHLFTDGGFRPINPSGSLRHSRSWSIPSFEAWYGSWRKA